MRSAAASHAFWPSAGITPTTVGPLARISRMATVPPLLEGRDTGGNGSPALSMRDSRGRGIRACLDEVETAFPQAGNDLRERFGRVDSIPIGVEHDDAPGSRVFDHAFGQAFGADVDVGVSRGQRKIDGLQTQR